MVQFGFLNYFLLVLSACVLSTAFAAEWNDPSHRWSSIWATAPQLVEPGNLPPEPFNISGAVFANSTLRQTFRVTLGAPQIRLRVSNAFSVSPVSINSITVALPLNGSAGTAEIQRNSLKTVRFNNGDTSITIPKASLAVSDPIDIGVIKGQVLTITIYLQAGIAGGAVTGHPGSRTDSWLTFGNQVKELKLTGQSLTKTAHWYLISGIEGWVPRTSKFLSIIGDSITDGRGSTTNGNDRWPDKLSNALISSTSNAQVAVGNQGLGGNCVLSECLGPNALSRVDRDVIAQSGVTHAMIFEGINDIGGGDASPTSQKNIGDNIIDAYRQFITRVHAAGLPAIGATITPFGGSFYDEITGERQKTRTRVNAWIRNTAADQGGFDFVADFDKAIRNPQNLTALRKDFDSGDGLHPNTAAYDAMVEAFPFNALR